MGQLGAEVSKVVMVSGNQVESLFYQVLERDFVSLCTLRFFRLVQL